MKVPSYEDLTPGIPDVESSQLVPELALFLDNSQRPTPNSSRCSTSSSLSSWALGVGSLFACLRLRTANCQLQTLIEVARDFSPRVMRASNRDVLLDVSGLGGLIGEPAEILKELTRALADAHVEASAAIGPTQTAARLLAAQSPDYPITRLPDLPVSLLRPLEVVAPGMTERDRVRPYEIFETWGIRTLADLAALPAGALRSRLGRRGAALQQLARGRDLRPFVPDGDTPRYVERLELEWPIDGLEPLSFVLARLLDSLSASLERADRAAAAVRLDLRLVDRSVHARMLQLPAPMRDPRVLRTLLLLDLEASPCSAAIDVVTIELDPAPARITQFSLLTRALPSPETLSTLTARLSALMGESRVGSPVLLDTHRPDAFEMARFTPDLKVGLTGDLPQPSPILRRHRTPLAIRVTVERGRPVHVASSRRGVPYGAIGQAAGPWRSSGEWWVSSARLGPSKHGETSSGGGGWSRDTWDVALSSGAVCRIYQDRITERWFLEGVYD
jgi:protein ImuB